MKARKIGIIMKKNKIRDNILISLQKIGYRVYVIPEDKDVKEIFKKMEVDMVILGECDSGSASSLMEYLRTLKAIKNVPTVVLVDKKVENADIVKILREGATDIVYMKDDNIEPLIDVVDRFMGEARGEFELKNFKIENTQIMQILGELDITNSFKVQMLFNKLVEEGEKDFIFDISAIDYLESVGLGILIHIRKTMEDRKGRARFIIKSARIKKLLSMVNLEKYFEIYEDIDELVELPDKEKRIKVAIVDDAKLMRKIIRDILEKEGFEVMEFESPFEALAEITKVSVDVVVVDYEMPGMDGLEFIEKFKPQVREIPTVMLTTETNVNLALKAIRMGASDFLNKPIQAEELSYILKKIVKNNNLKKENQKLFLELKRREKEL